MRRACQHASRHRPPPPPCISVRCSSTSAPQPRHAIGLPGRTATRPPLLLQYRDNNPSPGSPSSVAGAMTPPTADPDCHARHPSRSPSSMSMSRQYLCLRGRNPLSSREDSASAVATHAASTMAVSSRAPLRVQPPTRVFSHACSWPDVIRRHSKRRLMIPCRGSRRVWGKPGPNAHANNSFRRTRIAERSIKSTL